MQAFEYHEPSTLDEAVGLLSTHGDEAHAMAGGTALVLLISQGLVEPGHVVSLRRLTGLRGIRRTADGGLEVGALTTLREMERSPEIAAYAPALVDALRDVATVRIRGQATIGGNLAHADPSQDPPPVLLALDAAVVARGSQGERVIPLDRFFVDVFETELAPGEVLTALRLPPRPSDGHAAFRAFLPRSHDDYSTVTAAVSLRRDRDGTLRDVRIGLGSVAATPVRARSAEALLEGYAPDAARIAAAAAAVDADIDPVSDVRASAAYRREMARVFTRRTIEAVLDAADARADGADAHGPAGTTR